ncbi:hypothetical protein ACFL04_01090 [Patescibacteria group bacterium]
MATEQKKEKYSAWSIFYAIIFVILLVLLGERAWGDLDKFFNPQYSFCHDEIIITRLVNVEAAGPGCEPAAYEANRLVFHIALVVPLLFIMQLIYYMTGHRRLPAHQKIMIRSYFLFLLYMTIRLFVEITLMLFRYYSEAGFYVIIGFTAVVFAFLVVLVQRRFSEKNLPKTKDNNSDE